MATKTKDQITVICDGLFLNDTKPTEWTQSFPWKASVGFHFRVLDDSGTPTEEVHKKYLKEIWLFQAMGGKNAQGHFFRCTTETGEVPARDGQPAKPYVTVMPIAEVFTDGTSHFIDPPKDGKIVVPASAGKPKAPPPPAGPKTPASGPVAPKPAPPAPAKQPAAPLKPATEKAWKDANTAKAAAFFSDLEKPQSDGWWTMKTQIGYDGADACNVLDFAKQMTMMEIANYKAQDGEEDVYTKAESCLDYWCGAMRDRLLRMKFSNIRARLSHYLTLCVSVENVDQVIKKAWTELPESDFLALRSEAIDHVRVIQSQTEDGVFKGKITGTLQPEVPGGQDFFAPDDPTSAEADRVVDAPQVEIPAAGSPPGD